MQKQIAVVFIAILFIVVGLCGCITEQDSYDESDDSDELDKFVGMWKSNDIPTIMIFNSDRTCYIGALGGIYKLNYGTLVVDLYEGVSVLYEYQFSDGGNTLTLIEMGQATFVYTKQ